MSSDVESLLEMGWPKNYAEKALKETNYQGLQAALEWIIDHPQEETSESGAQPTMGDSTEQPSSISTPDQIPISALEPQSYICEDCGKTLKTPDDIQMHSARTGHANFHESTDDVKPLTDEEKKAQMARVQEHLRLKKVQREILENERQLENEKKRRSQGKHLLSAKAQFQEDEMKRNVELQKKEKEEDRKYREHLLAIMAKEKEEKLAKANANKLAGNAAPTLVTPPISHAPKSSPKTAGSSCQLNIRTPSGVTLKKTFKPDDTLDAVARYVREKWPNPPLGLQNDSIDANSGEIHLQTSFPVHKFDSSEMFKSLLELGLCPSAVLNARR